MHQQEYKCFNFSVETETGNKQYSAFYFQDHISTKVHKLERFLGYLTSAEFVKKALFAFLHLIKGRSELDKLQMFVIFYGKIDN